jgi:hypothetical protein
LNGDLSEKVGEGHFPEGEVEKATRKSRVVFSLLLNSSDVETSFGGPLPMPTKVLVDVCRIV